MKNKFCDLHTHSYYSDGTFSPREIIDEAIKNGIGAVALTDHNTTAGLAEFSEYAKDFDIEAICGVELSTDFGERELHIVGLYVSPDYYAEINELTAAMQRRKEAANRRLIDKLCALGMNISYERASLGARGQLNRAHIAHEMYRQGYVSSIADAFARYLDPKLGIYEPPVKLDVFETIKYLRKIGAVPVLAHPFYSLENEENVERFLSMAAPTGLVGIESRYSTHTEKMCETISALAKKYSVIESGGSDFHGEKRPGVALGLGYGDLRVPIEFATRLREYAK
jgi:predicted metal-dependent phosphoesterase TrpH